MSSLIYSATSIQDDINFVRGEMEACKIKARPGSGLDDVLENAQAAILDTSMSEAVRRRIHALNTLALSLRVLKSKGIVFCHQLNNMRRGTFEYGKAVREERWYKDFEFELFAAAQLANALDGITLPQNDDGNDIFYKDIEIQCKHPDSNDITRRQTEIAKLNTNLEQSGKYGILGLAIEDMAQFDATGQLLAGHEGFATFLLKKRQEAEQYLSTLLFPFICQHKRIIGVFTTSSYYGWIAPNDIQMRLQRDANGVILNHKDTSDQIREQVAEVIAVFNPAFRMLECK